MTELERLADLCRQERARGLSGHWSYDKARHAALFAEYLKEKQRRDIEAIDSAFERASVRILEAAQ